MRQVVEDGLVIALVDPRMVDYKGQRFSLGGVHDQDFGQQVNAVYQVCVCVNISAACLGYHVCTFAQMIRILYMARLYLLMQCRQACVIKRHSSAHQHIQDHAKAPHIDFGASVVASLQQFRGSKVEGAAKGVQESAGRVNVGQSKVDNLDFLVVGDEDVFNLEVSMHNGVSVAIV